MKRKVSTDKNKAASLQNMARISLERLNSLDKTRYPSNTVEDYCNILHNLMESLSALEGIKFSGSSAHKELIDWACKKMKFSDSRKIFLQSMRNYRNRISYEGFFINAYFINQNNGKILKIIGELNSEIEKRK